MTRPFRGGVHPREGKATAGSAIAELPPPSLHLLPLSQHIGAPSECEVKVGDSVARCQRIARAGGFVSVPLHSPVAGKVVSVGPALHPSGRMLTAVTIEPDGSGREERLPADPGLARGPEAWRAMVRDAGLVGMGGAAFPSHVKLSPPPEKAIHTVIANGAECEPVLTADHRLMLEEPGRVLRGLAIAMACAGAKRGVVAVEGNKPDAATALRAASLPPGVEVAVLPVRYPQGAEKQLVRGVTGREIPSRGLPMDVGVVVQNVATLAAIGDAVAEGIPLVARVLTLGGSLPRGAGNYRVPLGTTLDHLVSTTGGLLGEPGRILLGGPMMGQAVPSLGLPVTKGTSGVLLFAAGELPLPRQRACVRCGACVRGCPMGLLPNQLGTLSEYGLFEKMEPLSALDCIECGCCAFDCPAGRPLVQYIRQGKGEILALAKRKAG